MKNLLATACLLFTTLIGQVHAQDLLVGVLEQPQCAPEPQQRVKVLFAKQGDDWIALDSASKEETYSFDALTWTVALDGRSAGQIETVDPGFHSAYSWTYPRDRFLDLKQGQYAPKIANVQADFVGWCDAPGLRPMVVVTEPNYLDPETWEQVELALGVKSAAFDSFQKIVVGANRCSAEGGYDATPFDYAITDVQFRKGYRDKQGRMLVWLGLDQGKSLCDGPPEPEWMPRWFLYDKNISDLGIIGDLVGAGDYDNDGKSELIFHFSGYNRGGYVMLYGDGFSKRIEFIWGYH